MSFTTNVAISGKEKDAVRQLNTLQSNAAELNSKQSAHIRQSQNIPAMLCSLERLGIKAEELDKLNVIHITGTKGKGSTSAFCESILRQHGYSTGFFSSPHLVEVRERIRLNGSPITKQLFTEYFWLCFKTLQGALLPGEHMPPYFKFLTLLMFKIFLCERPDVVIMEVGIGGRFDCTNVIRSPLVCGVTSLGRDHMELLGDTVEEIAWQKGGIFKTAVPAVTVPQPGGCIEVLRQCALEAGASLYLAPLFGDSPENTPGLGLDGDVQLLNASLAVQLCGIAIDRMKESRLWTSFVPTVNELRPLHLSQKYRDGLSSTRWPGRNYQIHRPKVTYYIDGAHTTESVTQAVRWFIQASEKEGRELMGKRVKRVLLFNCTGQRSAKELLEPIVQSECQFDYSVFCPNILKSSDHKVDVTNRRVLPSYQLHAVQENSNIWKVLLHQKRTATISMHHAPSCARAHSTVISRDVCNGDAIAHTYSHSNHNIAFNSDCKAGPISGSDGGSSIHLDDSVRTLSDLKPNHARCNGIKSAAVNTGCNDGRKAWPVHDVSDILTENCVERIDYAVHRMVGDGWQNASRPTPPQLTAAELECSLQCDSLVLTFPCVSSAVAWVSGGMDPSVECYSQTPEYMSDVDHVQVFVTGSLYLVGTLFIALNHEIA